MLRQAELGRGRRGPAGVQPVLRAGRTDAAETKGVSMELYGFEAAPRPYFFCLPRRQSGTMPKTLFSLWFSKVFQSFSIILSRRG